MLTCGYFKLPRYSGLRANPDCLQPASEVLVDFFISKLRTSDFEYFLAFRNNALMLLVITVKKSEN